MSRRRRHGRGARGREEAGVRRFLARQGGWRRDWDPPPLPLPPLPLCHARIAVSPSHKKHNPGKSPSRRYALESGAADPLVCRHGAERRAGDAVAFPGRDPGGADRARLAAALNGAREETGKRESREAVTGGHFVQHRELRTHESPVQGRFCSYTLCSSRRPTVSRARRLSSQASDLLLVHSHHGSGVRTPASAISTKNHRKFTSARGAAGAASHASRSGSPVLW